MPDPGFMKLANQQAAELALTMNRDLEAVCIGMATVDVLVKGVKDIPFDGSTVGVSSVSICSGGDALNEAIALARLGHRVGLLASIGNDEQGTFLIDQCEHNAVDISALVQVAYPTPTSIVLVADHGERSFLTPRETALDSFGLNHIDLGYIRPGLKVLSIGSLFFGRAFDADVLAKILEKAKSVGVTTIADFVPSLHAVGLESIRDALALLDFVVPSREEACLYTGKTDLDEIADVFFDYGVGNVIIKLGGEGVFAKTPTQRFRVGPYPSVVVDTTGAGDNFVAGFISGLIRNKSLLECLKIGAATASIAVQSVGATTGIRNFPQVKDVMEENQVVVS